MNGNMTQPIWNPDTGITDLGADSEGLSASEIPGIRAVWTEQREQLRKTAQLSDFTEKLSREWAIETGILENLYDIERGVTQTLIERGFQAELLGHGSTNKPRDYVIRLLRDQKDALDGVFDFVKERRDLSTSYIKELHAALLRSQDTVEVIDSQGRYTQARVIRGEWKRQPNYPMRDGVLYTYCPPEQVASEMGRLVAIHAEHIEKQVPAEAQAAWLHHRFTQVHPFQDGNGRVARAIASMVLIKNGLFPLVVTRDDKPRYLDALEAADKGDLNPLVQLIAQLQITQFRKASAISESMLAEEGGVDAALDSLQRAADSVAVKRSERLKRVFALARELEEDVVSRLADIQESVEHSLKRAADGHAWVQARQSDSTNDYFYRHQIAQNAKQHLGYFADTQGYRSWVALVMRWGGRRQGKLVFTMHGIGRPFNGSLICAPFLEFKDKDDEDGEGEAPRVTLAPVVDEGFVFFYNETPSRLLSRFRPWRDDAIKVALKELENNLW